MTHFFPKPDSRELGIRLDLTSRPKDGLAVFQPTNSAPLQISNVLSFVPQLTFKMTPCTVRLLSLKRGKYGIFSFFSFLAVMLNSDSLLSSGDHAVGTSVCKTEIPTK